MIRPEELVSANDAGAGGSQGACALCEFRGPDGSRCGELAEYEVPVWDLQPVPGIDPKGADQTGDSWCLRHAVCALTSVYQGPKARANFGAWNAKYKRAYELLQARAREVRARREAEQECAALAWMLDCGNRQLTEAAVMYERRLAEQQQQAEEIRAIAIADRGRVGQVEQHAQAAVAMFEAQGAQHVQAVEEQCRRRIAECEDQARLWCQRHEEEVAQEVARRLSLEQARTEEYAQAVRDAQAREQRAEDRAHRVEVEAGQRIRELAEVSHAAEVRATAATAQEARAKSAQAAGQAQANQLVADRADAVKALRAEMDLADDRVRTLRTKNVEEASAAERARNELKEEQRVCAEKSKHVDELAESMAKQANKVAELERLFQRE